MRPELVLGRELQTQLIGNGHIGRKTDVPSPIATMSTRVAEGTLLVRGLDKRFGPVVANRDVDAAFTVGEVHGLLGENGAGKSTLVKVLAGIYQPDAGAIELDGNPVAITSPVDARRLGIAVVHQHSTLIPALTVMENVELVEGGYGRVSRDLRERLAETAARMVGFDVDPDARAETLSVGQRQRVEITRALMHSARFVVLDEPTSVLAPAERAELFDVVERLVSKGAGVVLVTHRLDEARFQCDRLTMLRQGEVVGRSEHPSELEQAEIVKTLVGDVPKFERRRRVTSGEVVAQARGVEGSPPGGRRLQGIDLTVRAGEILGIAGVEGNGQRELAAAFVGTWIPQTGAVELDGRPVTDYPPRKLSTLVADIADEDDLGLILDRSVWQNLLLRRLAWEQPPTPRVRRRFRREAVDLVKSFEIKAASIETAVGRLSGGNRRRVMLARELSKDPRLVVASYATKGLDVRSIEQVKGWILRLAQKGAAVVYIAAELEELLAVADRVAVMSRGRVAGVLDGERISVDEIGRLMLASATDENT